MDRFYCPELPAGLTGDNRVTLEGTEAHHLIHVLRAKPGTKVELFAGDGRWATATIVETRKRDAVLEIDQLLVDPAPAVEIWLATAVPKGDRFDWLVEKITELGVHRLIPLTTARSVVDPRESKLERLKQTAVAACKQSRRSHLMTIAPVDSWDHFLKNPPAQSRFWLADPAGAEWPSADAGIVSASRWIGLVGPEGGLTADEIALAKTCGATPLKLGPHILRIETAGIAFASVALHRLGGM